MSAIMVHQYIVKGRVQGVGFRWYVQRKAAALGLRGWVRNTSGGDVEVLAAGSEELLSQLHKKLQNGSRGSRVDRIEIEHRPAEDAEKLQAFEIEGAW